LISNSIRMHNWTQTLGLVSAALTTTAFLPQAIKAWKTRSTQDLSPLMFTLFFFGILGWLCYGLLIRDLPMILANAVTILLAGTIIYFILSGRTSTKLSHVAIKVRDIDLMRGFYALHFGAKTGKKYENPDKGLSSCFLHFTSGAGIELLHYKDKPVHIPVDALGHFAISLGSRQEVDRCTSQLKENGIEIISNPRLTGDGYYESVIRDPEGNVIELTV